MNKKTMTTVAAGVVLLSSLAAAGTAAWKRLGRKWLAKRKGQETNQNEEEEDESPIVVGEGIICPDSLPDLDTLHHMTHYADPHMVVDNEANTVYVNVTLPMDSFGFDPEDPYSIESAKKKAEIAVADALHDAENARKYLDSLEYCEAEDTENEQED